MKPSRDCVRYVVLTLSLTTPTLAATWPNIRPGMMDGDIDRGSLGAPRNDMPVQTMKATAKPLISANPLWEIPLSTLTATRERPLFSPSRRPPKPFVANAPAIPQPQAPPPAIAEHSDLILIGTVTGDGRGVAVFIDKETRGTVRLRAGEGHKGWILRSVEAKSVTLHKNNATERLALPLLNVATGSTPIMSALPPAPSPPPIPAQPVGAITQEKPAPQPKGCMPFGC